MDLFDKYLGEAQKWYIHVVGEDDGTWSVQHSSQNHPRLGGQVLKEFKSKKKAIEFALKHQKNETILSWIEKGNRATGAKWTKEGVHTKLSKLRGK